MNIQTCVLCDEQFDADKCGVTDENAEWAHEECFDAAEENAANEMDFRD